MLPVKKQNKSERNSKLFILKRVKSSKYLNLHVLLVVYKIELHNKWLLKCLKYKKTRVKLFNFKFSSFSNHVFTQRTNCVEIPVN